MSRGISDRIWERRVIENAAMLVDNALHPDLFTHFMENMSELYPGSQGVINYGSDGEVERVWAYGQVTETLPEYEAYYHRLNPYPKVVEQENLSDATAIFNRHLPRPKLWETEYYNDFLKPQGVEYSLGLSIEIPDGGRTSYTLYRGDAEGGDFDRDDVRRLDMLRPFLRQAVMRRKESGALSITGRETDAEPALLVLDDGTACSLNPAGDRYLQRRGPVRYDRAALDRMRLAATVGAKENCSVVASSMDAAIVRERENRLREVFRLTPRESQVATAIVRGLPYREVAVQLGISVETVRTFARSIHRKTGVNSTKRFIRLVEDLL